MKTLIYILTGLISGIISGMGIGGGVVLIPALTMLLAFEQKEAQYLNLIYFLPTAAIALITHIRNKAMEKSIILRIAAAGIISAVLGSMMAARLSSDVLRRCFGGFLLVLGGLSLGRRKVTKINDRHTSRMAAVIYLQIIYLNDISRY